VVVREDLNVAGLLKNRHLAQAIGDVGCSEFRRQLVSTAACYGSRGGRADRWEPSSTTCAAWGWVHEPLSLADRTFRCWNPHVACGLILDRDLNAAIPRSTLAASSSARRNAGGAGSAGQRRMARVELPSVKQEPNTL
jgi:putative transposase